MQVPVITDPSVAPQAAPNVQQSNPVSADMMNAGNRQTAALGDSLMTAGNAITDAQRQAQTQANVVKVLAAENQYREQAQRLKLDPQDGFVMQTGYDAVTPDANGQSLPARYGAQLKSSYDAIASGLDNEAQRQMFAGRSGAITGEFMGAAMQHTDQQVREYTTSTLDATAKTSASALMSNPLDEKNVATNITNIRASIEGGQAQDGTFIPGTAQIAGKSATWAKAKSDETVSSALTASVKLMMDQGNVNGAMAFRKKYSDQFQPADLLQIDGALTRNYDLQQGALAARSVMQAAQPGLAPNAMDRLLTVRDKLESGGRDYNPDGSPLTSSAGAMYRAQVMPATAANPGHGIAPAKDDSAAEYNRVGDALLPALVQKYGDPAKALAAYNWGEGNVDKAIAAARQNGDKYGDGGPQAWLANAPKETQAYVANGMKMLGDPSASAPPRPTLEQLHQSVVASMGLNASPGAVQAGVQAVTQQFEDHTKALAQQSDQAVSAVQQELIANGGHVEQVTPSKLSAVQQLAPGKYDDVLKFAKAVSKGDNETNMAAYNAAMTYPEELARMSDSQFMQFVKTNFSLADQEKVVKLRANQINATPDASTGAFNSKAMNDALSNRLQSIGINPTPKRTDLEDQARVGAIKKFVVDSIYDQQKQLGRKMTPEEIGDHIDSLFVKNVSFRPFWSGSWGGEALAWLGMSDDVKPMLGMRVSDIPSNERNAIRASFAARGQPKPTDQDVLGAYWRYKKNAPNVAMPAQE